MMRRCNHCKRRHICSTKKKVERLRRVSGPTIKQIREGVRKRAGNDCELGPGGVPEWGTELHHLEGGSGRLALQKVENCMWVCMDCHKAFHRHPEDYRRVVLNWARQYGYPVPRRFRGPPKRIATDALKAQEK